MCVFISVDYRKQQWIKSKRSGPEDEMVGY